MRSAGSVGQFYTRLSLGPWFYPGEGTILASTSLARKRSVILLRFNCPQGRSYRLHCLVGSRGCPPLHGRHGNFSSAVEGGLHGNLRPEARRRVWRSYATLSVVSISRRIICGVDDAAVASVIA